MVGEPVRADRRAPYLGQARWDRDPYRDPGHRERTEPLADRAEEARHWPRRLRSQQPMSRGPAQPPRNPEYGEFCWSTESLVSHLYSVPCPTAAAEVEAAAGMAARVVLRMGLAVARHSTLPVRIPIPVRLLRRRAPRRSPCGELRTVTALTVNSFRVEVMSAR